MRKIQKRQRDIQRAAQAGECTRCGGEIYPGGTVWRLCGQTLCEECLLAWLLEELAPFRGRGGEVRQ